MLTSDYPRESLAHLPTPLEHLPNISAHLNGPNIWIKRDDCTGLAMGGNKVRQLEFYLGDALAKGADTVLTTGADQSNHVRLTIAAARKLGLDVQVQLEKRVSGRMPSYYQSGNPYLMRIMGATIHSYPYGEDEDGADNALYTLAGKLRESGKNPYVIPLSSSNTPYGSLGYVDAAEELLSQIQSQGLHVDAIVLATGSATTHSGLLAGLRACGCGIPVYGFCVRRNQHSQFERVLKKSLQVVEMIGREDIVSSEDIIVDDSVLGAGYGQLTEPLCEAVRLIARYEGILLDPTYTGKAMAGLIQLIRKRRLHSGQHVIFLHTGGTPALFGYPELLDDKQPGAEQHTIREKEVSS